MLVFLWALGAIPSESRVLWKGIERFLYSLISTKRGCFRRPPVMCMSMADFSIPNYGRRNDYVYSKLTSSMGVLSTNCLSLLRSISSLFPFLIMNLLRGILSSSLTSTLYWSTKYFLTDSSKLFLLFYIFDYKILYLPLIVNRG